MTKKTIVLNKACKDRFQPVISRINDLLTSDTSPILIAIDGMCASGKTTLGHYLSDQYDCNLFHMDDFFLQSQQRTKERLMEIGGNVDYERFLEDVLTPLLQGRSVPYRPYDCASRSLQPTRVIPAKRLNIIEGSYSHHPFFGDIYQQRVFLKVKDDLQIQRIRQRNGDKSLERFLSEWIPKENAYHQIIVQRDDDLIIK